MSGKYVTAEEVALRCNHARPLGLGYICSCPLHEDNHASLKVSPGEKATVLWCHAGCSTVDVLTALGLRPEQLFYDYDPDSSDDLASMRAELREYKRAMSPPPALPHTVLALMEEAFALPQPWHTKGLEAALELDIEVLGEAPNVALRRRSITRDTVVHAYFEPWCVAQGKDGTAHMQLAEWGMNKLQTFWLERKREWL